MSKTINTPNNLANVDEPNIINIGSELLCPSYINLNTDPLTNSNYLTTNIQFKQNDVIYVNTALICDYKTKIMFKINGVNMITTDDLFITRETYREFLYFDSFMNHSCDPNTKINYIADNVYQMVAIRDIEQHEELTCDYNCLDNNYNNEKNIITCQFTCKCLSPNCKQTIYS